MAPPPKPKGPRARPPSGARTPPPRRHPTLELPFNDDEVLHADDPRPQRVPQYPAEALPARRPQRKLEEAIPTRVYDFASEDEELSAPWDAGRDGGEHKPAFLYVEKGPGQGQLVPVPQGPMVIGRASVSELRLQHPSISRRHAQLTRLGERFYLKDLGSQNATFVNRVRLEAEVEVYPGDVLQIGSATIKLRGPAEHVPPETRRKLDKVQSAARRSGPRPAPVRTKPHPVPSPPSSRRNIALLAVACVGIGVGLAAIGLVGWKLLQPAPTFQALARGGDVVEVEEVEVSAAQEDSAPTGAEDRVAERIAQQMEKTAPAAKAVRAAPKPPVVKPAAAPSRAPKKVEPKKVEPKTAAVPTRTEILKLYEAGNVSGAISAAKQAGDADLAERLTEFQTAHAAGEKGLRENDAGAAVAGYKKALAVDEALSGGWGAHAPAIAKKLGQLYAQYGQHLTKNGNPAGAQTAFKESLKYDPQNSAAREGLAGGSAPKGRSAAIDDAWGEETAAGGDRQSAMDEAWGD